jgi:Tfp pilus assembly protein FimT
MTAHKRSQRFSIIEFLSVLVVLAVLAVAAALIFSPFRHIQLESAVDKVMSDLRYCQELAICRNIPCGVVFEPARSRYTLYQYGGAGRSMIKDPLTRRGKLRIDFASGVYKGFTFAGVNVQKGTELKFAAGTGVPLDAAGAALTRPATVVIRSSAAGCIVIYVDPETGRVWRS